ncbi:hypothetical protein NPIL_693291 [Nephila pilipes]|uniref:Reverse transcriptase domain-containing protein n=1 Tax=Nephila pilipes TaxID=299642 RepID=A0A8X6QP14_NEPPI|nr:hypothetical protein NPIL_693291 [Nephila pilipes]
MIIKLIDIISKSHLSVNILLFADDMVMSATGSVFAVFEMTLQQALNVLGSVSGENNMVINTDKTPLFSFSCKHYNIQLCYKSKDLARTNSTVILGIHVDSKLTWQKHIHTAIDR